MRLAYAVFVLVLAACAPPADPSAQPEAQSAPVVSDDCLAAVEAMPVDNVPQPVCDWGALVQTAPEGSYSGYYSGTSSLGGLGVAPREDGVYAVGVAIEDSDSGRRCDALLDGRVDGDALALTPRDESGRVCRARLVRGETPNDITLQVESNCSSYCAAGVGLDGSTFRRSRR